MELNIPEEINLAPLEISFEGLSFTLKSET